MSKKYPYRASFMEFPVTVLESNGEYVTIEFEDGDQWQTREDMLEEASPINPHDPPRTFKLFDAHCGIWIENFGSTEITRHQHVHSDTCACANLERVIQWAHEAVELERRRKKDVPEMIPEAYEKLTGLPYRYF